MVYCDFYQTSVDTRSSHLYVGLTQTVATKHTIVNCDKYTCEQSVLEAMVWSGVEELNTIRMNWNADCVPSLLAQHYMGQTGKFPKKHPKI